MNLFIIFIYNNIYLLLLTIFKLFYEIKYINYLYEININKEEKNLFFIKNKFFSSLLDYNYLGLSFLLRNNIIIKFLNFFNLIVDSISIIKDNFKYSDYIINKKITNYIFYNQPKFYYYISFNLFNNYNNSKYFFSN
jgi:hypothetical protein